MIISIFNQDQQRLQKYSFRQTQVLIGRNPSEECSVVVNSASISRNHLKAKNNGGQIEIMDMNSSNGTFVNGKQLQKSKWISVSAIDMIKLAEYEGFLKIQIRQSQLKHSSLSQKLKNKAQDSDSNQSFSRSRQKANRQPLSKIKLNDSTLKMLKEMTNQKKSKDQRIKFLKLMGYPKAEQSWHQIEEILKNKKGLKLTNQKAQQQLQKQFNQSRVGHEKKGLGRN